jgi:hypothetical protein
MTSEDNKLIAEFMGFKKHDENTYEAVKEIYFVPTCIKNGEVESWGYVFPIDCLLFHSDWNWLMEVVEKIYSMDEYYKYKNDTTFMFSDGGFELTTDKTDVYNSVVDFINWFNANK